MAGNRIPMGIGKLGFSNLVFKKKYQWTFEVFDICGGQSVPRHYVKLASRPNLSIEETEINFLNGKKFLPGKGTWETLSVTYYDVATVDQAPLFSWLASVYNFTDPINLTQGSQSGDYSGRAVLTHYDGCGTPLDMWTLYEVWPNAINFGELDYGSSEECTIELTLRFQDAQYKPLCPAFPINPCCSPCGTGGRPGVVGGRLANTGSNSG